MPFTFLKNSFRGRKLLGKEFDDADTLFQAYVWNTANYTDGSITAAKLAPGQFGGDYIKLTDTKATTVNGGASIAGTQTRVLNTEDSDTGGHCTLASNQFTLAAGTYRINANASAYATRRHKLFLYNVSDTVNEIIGTSEYDDDVNLVSNKSFVSGQFEITASKTFEIRHYTQLAVATFGLGVSSNDGTSEVYTIVELWKIK